jgi:SAM-dependent methyltransferase
MLPAAETLGSKHWHDMTDLTKHWNDVFAAKDDPQLGWYERDVSQTLGFLELVPGYESATIFLPGAGTSLLVDALLDCGARLVLNDISDEALGRLQRRVGERKPAPIWLHHDIAKPLPSVVPPCDIWLDRAVLHFLLTEDDITAYFQNLRTVLAPNGHVILAEFALHGAPKCAGLDVHRYSAEEMGERLGPEFAIVKAEEFIFINPAGGPRPYVYTLFRRR